MVAMYSLECQLAEKKIIKENSVLWGLWTWMSLDTDPENRYINKEEIEKFENFCRHKALTAFEKEGIGKSLQ